MFCVFHPTMQAVGKCSRCAKPLCASCEQAASTLGACSACVAGAAGATAGRRILVGTLIGCGVIIVLAMVLWFIFIMGWLSWARSPDPQGALHGPQTGVEQPLQRYPEGSVRP